MTAQRPDADGWHDVWWEGDKRPTRVFLRFVPNGVIWGWDEEDDPEMVDADDVAEGRVRWERREGPGR